MVNNFPTKQYRTIVVDPPWDVKRGPEYNSNGASRILTYPTMSIEEIKQIPVNQIAEKGCHIYIWTINKYISQTYEICTGWGFKPSTLLVWAKNPRGIGLGGTYSLTTEFILFARNGTCPALKRVDTTWWLYKRGKYSQKPEQFQQMIETVSPSPRIELFARRQIPNWDVWGNEITDGFQEASHG